LLTTFYSQIKEILFDCDNTLVLSESLAFEACAELANEILEAQGISDRFTGPQLLSTFVGQNFRGMMLGLQKMYNFELPESQLEDYVNRELGAVTKKLNEAAQPCEGVMEELEKLKESGRYGLAVVSSSALPRVVASIKKTEMDHYFPSNHIFSAATSLEKPTSKPDPAIYLHACKVIGVQPGECVAVEDSKSGATAAKNAKIPLIGYVGAYLEEGKEKQESVAKMLKEECGAIVVMYHWSEFEECLKKVEAS
jgi:beta-phosphoglucomutase-like phosphatase (HAD superfamily)